LRTLLNRTPRDFQLGRIRVRQGAFAEAVLFLSVALGAGSPDPNDTVATLNDLMSAELAQGQFDGAIDHARRALDIQQGNPIALQALSMHFTMRSASTRRSTSAILGSPLSNNAGFATSLRRP